MALFFNLLNYFKMKETKSIYTAFIVFMINWAIFALIGCFMSNGNITYRQAFSHPPVLLLTLLFGWIPAIFAAKEIQEN